MSQSHPDFLKKIVPPQNLNAHLATKRHVPFVFTNGVFDVLHTGHATYLANARELGSLLMVAINTDASVKRLGKGADRPINPLEDRATMLAALEMVDIVTWFDEDTPCELIAQIKPDILVKGGDYDMALLPESKLMKSWGGKALALPFVSGYSTTSWLNRVKQIHSK